MTEFTRAVVPLKSTVFPDGDNAKPDPVMVTVEPIAPDDGLKLLTASVVGACRTIDKIFPAAS